MNKVVADAVRVFIRPEGIVLEFGHGPDGEGEGEGDIVIEPLKRLVLPPATLRRLGMALAEELRVPMPAVGPPPSDRVARAPASRQPPVVAVAAPAGTVRARAGAIAAPAGAVPARAGAVTAPAGTVRAKPALEALLDPTREMPSSRAQPSRAAEDANRLFRLVSGAGVPFVYERSFRMREGELLANRYLLSAGRQAERGETDKPLAGVFRQLDMPGEFLEAAERNLPLARCVHFGFEADARSHLLKVYLEVAAKGDGIDAVEGAWRPADDAVLEHIAYKWNPAKHEERVIGQYLHWPALSAAAILSRVREVYEGAESQESLQIAEGVVQLAAGRMPEEDIHYLEIEEAGGPRRSFSINFYDAGLTLTDLYPFLSRMRRRFGVAPGQFQALYDQIKERKFGHLAGGLHRNGKDFFNVYYGPQFFDEGQWRNVASREGLR